MKKYKLLKWYPSCLDLKEGQIITKWIGSAVYSLTKNSMFFNPQEVEENPEFWEEIIEKDYEILSFKEIASKHHIITKSTDGFGYQGREENFLKSNDWQIHSVKRLSDGEIFTLGDKVDSDIRGFIITKLRIIGSTICVNGNGCQSSLAYLKPVKKPLFTTFDNVDIFEGDELHSVHKISLVLNCGDYFLGTCHKDFTPNNNYIYFSTKQAAQDYINSKKVLFTTEDGVDIFKGDKVSYVNFLDTIMRDVTCTEKSAKHDLFKWFSTEQAAQDYINSNKVLFTTEDGVDKCEGDDYYFLHKHSFRIDKAVAHKSFIDGNTSGLYFNSKKLAEEYILHRKPCLSMQDLKSTGCLNEKQWFAILDLVKHKSKL